MMNLDSMISDPRAPAKMSLRGLLLWCDTIQRTRFPIVRFSSDASIDGGPGNGETLRAES